MSAGNHSIGRRVVTGALKIAGVALMLVVGYFALTGTTTTVSSGDRHAAKTLEHDETIIGVSPGVWPGDDNPVIAKFEAETHTQVDLVDVFLDWYTPYQNVSYTVEHILRHGSIAQLSWEAHGFTTQDMIAGTKTTWLRDGRHMSVDKYLDEFSSGLCDTAKAANMPVFLRTLHEFNGNWFTWGLSYEDSHGNRPNTDASYRQAWIKIHDIFTAKCGSLVKFVWAVNHFSVGQGATFTGPYPGDDYVDYVGLDGYNWGTSAHWGWQTFDEIFTPSYCAVTRETGKPILLSEISSSERGGDKAEWINELFDKMEYKSYPQLKGLVWFNSAKYEIEIRGPMDWPVDSSEPALQAFIDGAAHVRQADTTGTPAPAPADAKGPNCSRVAPA